MTAGKVRLSFSWVHVIRWFYFNPIVDRISIFTSRKRTVACSAVRRRPAKNSSCAALRRKSRPCFGGPEGIRTLDLFHAMEARSQLRHRPTRDRRIHHTTQAFFTLKTCAPSYNGG